MNDITFTVAGNVVKDVELRFTNGGDPVALRTPGVLVIPARPGAALCRKT